MQIIAIALLFAVLPPVPGKIVPELVTILDQAAPAEMITVIVHMNTEYPYAQMAGLTDQQKCQVFKDVAFNSQRDVVNYLQILPKDKAEMGGQFWIFNGFHVRAVKEIVEELARRDDVWFICDNAIIQLDDKVSEDQSPDAIEWNILKIKADSCWYNGFYGQNIIVGHIDTGVNTNHEALVGKWLSPYWLDPVTHSSTPIDDHNHGTHTMGTICGGDGPGSFVNDIGVAYGARFIPTKAFNSGGSGTEVDIDSCMQYLADLKSGGIDIRVIGNSWGNGNGSYQHWWTIVLNWETIGILPVFSNGNAGPGAGSVGSPGSYPMSLGVGATDASDVIASFSSRGPTVSTAPWNDPQYWYYSTWNYLKPDVSAPGVAVRSGNASGGYMNMDGTSMASPHVTGGTAVLLSKNHYLTVHQLYDYFRNYCDQPSGGAPYPNNNYGWGRINLWRSLQNVPYEFALQHGPDSIYDPGPGGNLNYIWESGETVTLLCLITVQGTDSTINSIGTLTTSDGYVTINNGTANMGTLHRNDTVWAAFNVTAAAGTPGDHQAVFNLNLAHTGGNMDFPVTVYINPLPNISYLNYTVTGGNGNSYLEPGETANLIVKVKNEGHTRAVNLAGTLRESSTYLTLVDSLGSWGTIAINDSAQNAGDYFTLSAASGTPIGTPIPLIIRFTSGSFVDTFTFNITVGKLMPSDTGYYYTYWSHGPYQQAPVYSWYAIDTSQTAHVGTSLGHSDDQTSTVILPFTFRYYGVAYTQLSICSNGWVAMGSTASTDYTNSGIPGTDGPPAMVGGIWDDLNPGATGPADDYYYNDATNHRFVVEWFRVPHYGSTNIENFEITLYDPAFYPTPTNDGEIIVQYRNAMSETDNTLGIENSAQTLGIQYFLDGTYHSLAVPVTDTFALKYTTVKPSLVGVEEGEVLNSASAIRQLTIFPTVNRGHMTIAYSVAPSAKDIGLRIYDIAGRLVRTYTLTPTPAPQILIWNGDDDQGRNVAAGIYFVKLTADDEETVNKAVLLR